MTSHVELPFLLGALYSRSKIACRNHGKSELTMSVPASKAWLLTRLQTLLGGSVYEKLDAGRHSVGYALTAQKGLTKLATLVSPHLELFPELKPLTLLAGRDGDTAIPRARAGGAPRRRRATAAAQRTDGVSTPTLQFLKPAKAPKRKA